ncbi:MAG: lipopolysaccharide biosynthesis protein [Pigmentiphaga sp.]
MAMVTDSTAGAPPRLARRAVVSLIDQAWLSLLNLALGLLLIRLTAKETYGTYAQLYVAGLFAASMAEALITNPLTTLAAGSPPERRAELIAHLSRFQGQLSTCVAVLLGLGSAAAVWYTGLASPILLGLVFAAYVKTSALREFRRSVLFLHHEPRKVLGVDWIFGLITVVGTAVLVGLGWLTLPSVFAVLALANLLALSGQPRVPAAREPTAYRQAVRDAWRRGRLALAGATLAWTVNYSYLYLAAIWLGAAASADLNATRLLLMPISLSVVAWSRVTRPAFGVHLVRGEWRTLRQLVAVSAAGLTALTGIYGLALWWSLPWLGAHVLGEQYLHTHTLVAGWSIYFTLNGLRIIYSSVLIAKDRYGYLLMVTGLSALTLLAIIGFAIPHYGTLGAVVALIMVEALSLLLIWAAYRFFFGRPQDP